ncbi:hypothetical protein JHK87_050416 [Glycine soja]|nr:hypothetical protein JHK87_050416 [Glycine soja]
MKRYGEFQRGAWERWNGSREGSEFDEVEDVVMSKKKDNFRFPKNGQDINVTRACILFFIHPNPLRPLLHPFFLSPSLLLPLHPPSPWPRLPLPHPHLAPPFGVSSSSTMMTPFGAAMPSVVLPFGGMPFVWDRRRITMDSEFPYKALMSTRFSPSPITLWLRVLHPRPSRHHSSALQLQGCHRQRHHQFQQTPSYGIGAIMVVPTHDSRDYEFALKYDVPICWVVMPDDKSIESGKAFLEIKNGDEQVKADAIRIGNYKDGLYPIDNREFAKRIFYTMFMGSKNSSKMTRSRAKVLANEIGSWHLDVSIDVVVSAFLSLFQTLTRKRPWYKLDGGSNVENLSLQNIQA